MILSIQHGEVYDPDPRGKTDVLCFGEKIVNVGEFDKAIEKLGLPTEILNAKDCYVLPGLIDPHEHLIGGSGEKGFASRTPEIGFHELLEAGITTVVGCLGVDTVTRTIPTLLAKVKGLNAAGLTAFMYSGGYDLPPVTLTDSIRKDILYIREVIGIGEIAISDERCSQPSLQELAHVIRDAFTSGLLTGRKCVCHFHVGEGEHRLQPLREVVEKYCVSTSVLYPTHIGRSEKLMKEAIEFSNRGISVDLDTVEEDLPKWLDFYLKNGGNPEKLTLSTDAYISAPRTLFEQLRQSFFELKIPLEALMAFATRNTAEILGLKEKGRIEPNRDADLMVVHKKDFKLKHLIARGKVVLRDEQIVVEDPSLKETNRQITLYGRNQRK